MNRIGSAIKPRMWFVALLLTAVAAGCGGGGGGEAGAGAPAAPAAPAAPGAAPTTPGAGTGVNGNGQGPAPVNLGNASFFAIVAESTITNVPPSAVTGDVGLWEGPGTALLLTCSQVTFGTTIHTRDAGGPGGACHVPLNNDFLAAVVADKRTAYTDAQGRPADYTEVGAGDIGGMTLPPAVYKWGTGVLIPTNVTLNGGPNDVWIFQIAQGLTVSPGVEIILAGGAVAQNVYWATFGVAALDTTSKFNGVILSQTSIAMKTGATINGKLFAGTAVTLESNMVTQ